ncbi:MAG: cbb3-type cytochrome c oxidase subunit 3 [Planctomycetota bacterium]|nr:MAG: cbb3-type cytochrome c oxidase subunit 3 [Planctomycetota bacterium]
MSLTDIMSGANLALLPTVALLIFFGVFLAIVAWVLLRPKRDVERWARMPMDDDAPQPSRGDGFERRPN